MSASLSSSNSRRHDLDALRAIAMLLGIGLHAAIAYIPGESGGWAVKDTQTSGLFALLMASIHGFRMPLFFLISGFFTMMLFRKRGLRSLLSHRFKRIFLPMLIALLTIIPAMWAVSAYVQIGKTSVAASKPMDIRMAAAHGDTDRIEQLLAEGVDVDDSDKKGTTPLMMAALFGKHDAANLLIERHADVQARSHKGDTVEGILHTDAKTTGFIANLIGVEIRQDQVNDGRKRIAGMLPASAIDRGLAAKSRVPAQEENAGIAGLIALLTYIPIMGHLWFLWFLCWLVAGFALVMTIGRLCRIPSSPRWMSSSAASYAWLIPLTMIPQAFMGQGGLNFGPDTSIGLLPMPAVLAYYAIFFGFGAMYFDADDREGRMGRRWMVTIPICLLVLFPIGMATSGQATGIGKFVSIFTQAIYVWLMSFGLMGLFRRFLATESKTMRYLSDSSYWLYLAHLPLVILVQSWVRDYDVSPFLKFPFVCIVTSAILLVSYQWFIRYTPIGTLLNGKRTRAAIPVPVVIEAELVQPASSSSRDRQHEEVLV